MPDPRSWWRRLPRLPWVGRAVGEQNALRTTTPTVVPGFLQTYTLDSSQVNYTLARELYRNTNDQYKLGAGFAKPIVNTLSGFVGAPRFTHDDEDADAALEEHLARWVGTLLRLNRDALRDGDAYARIDRVPDRFDARREVFRLRLVPPEWVKPTLDPITGEWESVAIHYPVRWGEGTVERDYTVIETLTPARRTVVAEERAPGDLRARVALSQENPWGFIPIVHFKNEAEEGRLYGASELEAVEPFLKAYHDVMLNACQGAKLFSRPKVKLRLKDVAGFLKNNFSDEERRSGTLKFQGKDLYFFQEGEDAEFLTAESGIAGATTLLEFLFMCTVDVSGVPEFVFGTAIASSKASADAQMDPFVRTVKRKRAQLEEPYGELARMFLAMWARVENRALAAPEAGIDWDEVTPRNDAEVATTIKTLVEGLVTALEAGLLSIDAAAEFLREFVPTALAWSDPGEPDDEQRRVLKTAIWRRRLEDAGGLDRDEQDERGGGDDEDNARRLAQAAQRNGAPAAAGRGG